MSLRTESGAFLGDGLYENGRRKAYGEAVSLLFKIFPKKVSDDNILPIISVTNKYLKR